MKRNLLFALLAAGFVGVFFLACQNPVNGGGTGGGDLIANSSWSDALNPETTIEFSANQVTLGGGLATGAAKNWYWGAMDGQTYPFDLVEGAENIRALLDQVEDNWGTDYTTLPNAVIVVWTESVKNIGFQLHYYAAGAGKNYERLICWGIGQPHEFRRK
jgi:hypothetical protein